MAGSSSGRQARGQQAAFAQRELRLVARVDGLPRDARRCRRRAARSGPGARTARCGPGRPRRRRRGPGARRATATFACESTARRTPSTSGSPSQACRMRSIRSTWACGSAGSSSPSSGTVDQVRHAVGDDRAEVPAGPLDDRDRLGLGRGLDRRPRDRLRACGVVAGEPASTSIGRERSEATVSTGAPASSDAVIVRVSPSGAILTRSRSAPRRWTVTPFQAKGSGSSPFSRPSRRSSTIGWKAASSSAGWSAKRPGFVGLGGVERDLGVDLVALRRQARGDALEGRAVAEAGEREAVVEVLDVRSARRRAAARRRSRAAACSSREHAVGVALPLALARARVDADGPVAVRRRRSPTLTCTCAVSLSRRISGASSVSSSIAGTSATSPAVSASSSSAVPGSRTVPWTAWSASHGCVASESSPLSSQPSLPATGKAPLSSGWPGAVGAVAAAGLADQPVALVLEGVRGRADAPRALANSFAQSTGAPWTWALASANVKRSRPPSSRRRVPIAAPAPCSIVSFTAPVSTGCGLGSTNRLAPSSSSRSIVGAKRTGLRRLRYQ